MREKEKIELGALLNLIGFPFLIGMTLAKYDRFGLNLLAGEITTSWAAALSLPILIGYFGAYLIFFDKRFWIDSALVSLIRKYSFAYYLGTVTCVFGFVFGAAFVDLPDNIKGLAAPVGVLLLMLIPILVIPIFGIQYVENRMTRFKENVAKTRKKQLMLTVSGCLMVAWATNSIAQYFCK
jgi:hypothetical protein